MTGILALTTAALLAQPAPSAPAPAPAAAPAATRPPASATSPATATKAAPAEPPIPVRAGDRVAFDISAFPTGYEGTAKATCRGTVITAVGPEETVCERTYTFEAPPGSARMVYVFRPAQGSGERRIELPLTRERKPVEFVAPSDGALHPPAPIVLPPEAADAAAKRGAARACASCRGSGFELERFEVTRPPAPVGGSLSVAIGISSPAPASR